MKKIIIAVALVAMGLQNMRAQVDYGFNLDTLNSDSYLKRIGCLKMADSCRAMFIRYRDNAHMGDTISMLLTPYDWGNRHNGVYSVGNVVYVTIDRLKSDTIEFLRYFLNLELSDIKFREAIRHLGMDDFMVQAKTQWIVKNMGELECKKYLKLRCPQLAAKMDSIDNSKNRRKSKIKWFK